MFPTRLHVLVLSLGCSVLGVGARSRGSDSSKESGRCEWPRTATCRLAEITNVCSPMMCHNGTQKRGAEQIGISALQAAAYPLMSHRYHRVTLTIVKHRMCSLRAPACFMQFRQRDSPRILLTTSPRIVLL